MGKKQRLGTFARKVLRVEPIEEKGRLPAEVDLKVQETLNTSYLENEPTIQEWLGQLVPTKQGLSTYLHNLFPCVSWMRRYNLRWLAWDIIAGLTVGLVVIPQAMAYALLAKLTPEYGLYTSFSGAVLYWIFGTSKDIVIGTTAVGSLLVGNVIEKVQANRPGMYTNEDIAKGLSVLSGSILLFLGLMRLGWIIEFIPYIPISAFVTSASITIISTQFPVVMGIRGVNTREAPYKVIINTLKNLDKTKLDATIGLSSILLLHIIRSVCARMEVRSIKHKRMWGMISALRLTFAMLLYTFISWLVNRNLPLEKSKFRLVGHIDKGFKHAATPKMSGDLVGQLFPNVPAIVIILIIEHIAIAKNFGRTFGYTVIPSQEILAQGTSNIIGQFLGGYVCTGSFGASAVLSKAGVRTPLAGMFSAFVLVLALYALTAVFYYIPKAALAGLIIHAVMNLISSPKSLYKYWQLSPFELLIWFVGVILAIFTDLESSIYATIALSAALLLVRIARTQGRFLGPVRVQRIDLARSAECICTKSAEDETGSSREVYLPLDRKDSSNPNIKVDFPYPGVFIFRFGEGLNYVNQAQHISHLVSVIKRNTRPTMTDDGIDPKERLWTDPGPKFESGGTVHHPILRAVVLDCSSVSNLDITSIQGLVDLRNTLDRYAAPAVVEWHFAGLLNRWTRRALAVAGFGYPSADKPGEVGNWAPVVTVASSLAGATPEDGRAIAKLVAEDEEQYQAPGDGNISLPSTPDVIETADKIEHVIYQQKIPLTLRPRLAPVHGINRPFFHLDLVDAVDAAVRDAKWKDGNTPSTEDIQISPPADVHQA